MKRARGAKLLFDMPGLWADERVDSGLWPRKGAVHHTVKEIEEGLLVDADHMVTLTHASAGESRPFPYLRGRDVAMSVIPTCADLDRFRPPATRSDGPFMLGYLGSVGTWYLFYEVLECYKLIAEKRADARLLVVNRHEHDSVRERVAALGIAADRLELVSAEHTQVPALIARMTVGGAIIKRVYTKFASAPTKLPEYLGYGVPGRRSGGRLKRGAGRRTYRRGADQLSPNSRVAAVERLFKLLDGPTGRRETRSIFQKRPGVRALHR